MSVIDVNPNLAKSRNSFNRSNNNNSNAINNNNNNNKLEYHAANTNILNNYSEIVQINSLTNQIRLDSNNDSTNINGILLNTNSNLNINYNNNSNNNINTINYNNNNNNNITSNSNSNQHASNSIRNPFWNDESNSGWTGTGVMSDRSSVYSIDDGDFDREASRKVNNQLREIESILYEQNSTHSSNQNECNEWLEKFPHIRVLGTQILNSSKDLDLSNELAVLSTLRSSMQSIPISSLKNSLSSQFTSVTNNNSNNNFSSNVSIKLDMTSPIPLQNEFENSQAPAFNNYKYFRRRETSDLNCNQLLNVYGTSMSIRSLTNTQSDEYSAFEEEIFDQEGVYEELLAYDNQEEEYMFEHNKRLNLNKRRRHGLPPITPKAAMKDLVANFLFDHMWCVLIDWSAETIKTYAKNISDEFMLGDEASCKTPQLVSTPNPDLNDTPVDNSTRSLLTNTNTNSNSNGSPSYSSLMHNNTYVTNDTASISNQVINANPIATNVTKANIVQLKLFDSQFFPIQSYTPSLLTRDNSNLYNSVGNKNSSAINDNHSSNFNANNSDQTGDLMTKDLLQIKQLNRNGSSIGEKNKENNNNNINNNNNNNNNNIINNKALNPIMLSQSRVNSGNRRQLQINYYRKRYSSIEMGANVAPVDKNIIIHGAGLGKPSSLSHFNENSNSTNGSQTNAFLPFSNSAAGATGISNSYSFGNRSTNNSSQAYNHQMNNDENIYENEFNDYNLYEQNAENSIDEINLINQQSSSNSNSNNIVNNNTTSINTKPLNASNNNITHGLGVNHNSGFYNHSHLNYFGFHQHNSHLNHNNFQPLPPIENSLTLKVKLIFSNYQFKFCFLIFCFEIDSNSRFE